MQESGGASGHYASLLPPSPRQALRRISAHADEARKEISSRPLHGRPSAGPQPARSRPGHAPRGRACRGALRLFIARHA